MSLVRLSTEHRALAVELLLSSFRDDELDLILSQEGVYLGFQHELLDLKPADRRTRTAELSVLILGDGLLRNSHVREVVCRSKGIKVPTNWRPGSTAAAKACSDLGLPVVFAGTQPLPRPQLVEPLRARPTLPSLMDYQEEVLQEALDRLPESVLISLPTGGGKTRVGTEIVTRHLAGNGERSVLWLAHTEELCEQAAQCINEVWNATIGSESAALYRAWGRNAQKLTSGEMFQAADLFGPGKQRHQIVVSTPQSTLSLLESNVRFGALQSAFGALSLVVVDEAHRAAAPTYKRLLTGLIRERGSRLSVVGLSATPVRETYASDPFKGTRDLASLFRNLVEPVQTLGTTMSPVAALQERGVLAELRVHKLASSLRDARDLANQIAHHRKNAKSPSLAFVPTTAEAKVLASYLVELGETAESVTSKTPLPDRLVLIESLKSGQLDIICNCELLTTGFDAPQISQIFLARQTDSPVLYKQMVGRGLRGPQMGGSDACDLYLCGVELPFDADPNTTAFAREVWASRS